MDILEQYEHLIASEDVRKEFDGTSFSPFPAFYAEPVMKGTMEDIRKELNSYPDVFKNEPYQMYRRYQMLFRTHYDLLMNVHPLTSVGKDRIIKWREAVDEYEALSNGAYPLVTTVTRKSTDLVKHLIPGEFLELIDNPVRHIICAMRYQPTEEEIESYVDFVVRENEEYKKLEAGQLTSVSIDHSSVIPTKERGGVAAAGVLSFVEEEVDGDKRVRIEWLYVAPGHRNAGLCNALMYEMLYIMRDKPITGFVIDVDQNHLDRKGEIHDSVEPTTPYLKKAGLIPEDTKEEDFDPDNEFAPLVHFISNFKFEAGPVPEDSVHVLLSEINMTQKMLKLSMMAKEIHPLKEMDDLTFRKLSYKIICDNPGIYDDSIPFVGTKRYDKDISFFFQMGPEIVGMILVRITYEGKLLVEMVQATKSAEKIMAMLLTRVISEALTKYDKNTHFVVPVRHDIIVRLMENLVDDMYYRVGARAVLIRPQVDVSVEEWEELVNKLQDLSPEQLRELSMEAAKEAQ